MKKLIWLMLAVMVALPMSACSSAPGPENVSSEAEPVLVFPEEYVDPGSIIATSPQSGKLYESDGTTWVPSTPGLTLTSVSGGATSEHGTFNRTTNTAVVSLTSTNYLSFANALNPPASVLSYGQVDLQYDTTSCTPPVVNCPLSSWRLGVHTCTYMYEFPCPETAYVQ